MSPKPFKYFDTLDTFNSMKVSAASDDSAYYSNDLQVFGTPDVVWEDICFIADEKLIWTHGDFYNQDEYTALSDAEILALMPTDE